MSRIQKKIGRHTKNQENMTRNPEKTQPIYSDPEIIEMIKLADKDVKFTIINVQNHKS